jgi:hypothetical protein
VVEGDVRIQGCDTIVDVRGMSRLMTIAGSLVVEGNAILESLDGLEGLRLAGAEGAASLVIAENELLEDIAALRFANLSDMSLTLTENPRLASLSGLVGARSAESVIIVHNEALVSLDGLAGLTGTSNLTIADNPLLLDLNLPALRSAANLTLTGNSRLTTARLRSLLNAEMSVTVVGNTVLENLDMRKLTSVGGTLSITANPALNSFVLESLQSVSALAISSNASLPQCEVDELDAQLGGVCGSACTGNDSSALCQ